MREVRRHELTALEEVERFYLVHVIETILSMSLIGVRGLGFDSRAGDRCKTANEIKI